MSDQYPQDLTQEPRYSQYSGAGEGGMPQFPSGGESAPAVPPQPTSTATAVKLMYVGAALSLVSLVVSLLSLGSMRETIEEVVRETEPNASQGMIDAAYAFGITMVVVVSLFSVALWLWMAWKNSQGRSWARIVATVLGGLNVLTALVSFIQPRGTGVSLTLGIVIAILGLVILVLLWTKESTRYYEAVTQSRMLR